MPPFKVAVYLFANADLLDFSGPVEIFSCKPASGPAPFTVTSFAHHNLVKSGSDALVYVPNATFDDISSRIQEFDVLVIPGGHWDTITDMIKSNEGKELSALIQRFAATEPREETGKRVLQSVCTGSVLLAGSGVLAGRTITTHHMGLDLLKQVADEAAGGDAHVNVVRKRWVDAGTTDAGVQIVNAGGVSSGIDASLWVVEKLAGKEFADYVAEVTEWERRDTAWGV